MKKPVCLFTIQRDEYIFLPLWAKYYSQFIPEEDIYVFDHSSTLNLNHVKTGWPKIQWRKVEHDTWNDLGWYASAVSSLLSEFLKTYTLVAFIACDEFIYAPNGFRETIEKHQNPVIYPLGYEICEQPGEAPIDWTKSILSQRRFWNDNTLFFSKPAFCRVPVSFTLGCHDIDGSKDPAFGLIHRHIPMPSTGLFDCGKCLRTPDMICVHLHRADMKSAIEKYSRARSYLKAAPVNAQELSRLTELLSKDVWNRPWQEIPQDVIKANHF